MVLEAGGVGTLHVKWGLDPRDEFAHEWKGIVAYTVGTVFAIAGLVLAIPTGGSSVAVAIGVGSIVMGLAGYAVTTVDVAFKDWVNTPATKPGIELRHEKIFAVTGEIKSTFDKELKKITIVGDTKEPVLEQWTHEYLLERVNEKDIKKRVSPMDLAYEVGFGAKTISRPFVTDDGWVWYRETDNRLMKMRREGTAPPEHCGGQYTCAPPTVHGDWIYYLDTNSYLARMKTDGSQTLLVGSTHCQGFAPVVDVTGQIWVVGWNGALMCLRADGSGGGSSPGDVRVISPPTISREGTLRALFLGSNGALMSMYTNGTGGKTIGSNCGKTRVGDPPLSIDSLGNIWFWGLNGAVMKTSSDGTVGGNPQGAYSASPPVARGNMVYFQGLNGQLMCMRTDSTVNDLLEVHAEIVSPPFVAHDQWLFFQGRDNLLMRACFHKSVPMTGPDAEPKPAA